MKDTRLRNRMKVIPATEPDEGDPATEPDEEYPERSG